MFSAPAAVVVMSPRGPAVITTRPEVQDDEFCHEFTQRPPKTKEINDLFSDLTDGRTKGTVFAEPVHSKPRTEDAPNVLQGSFSKGARKPDAEPSNDAS
jgi:hypothetical protein